MTMKLLRTKVWSWFDIALLKWSCILLGIVVGIYLVEILRPYVLVLLVLALTLAVKPAVDYFRDPR